MKFKYLLITFIPLVFLVGCFDKSQLEERAYVIALGLDKAEEEGKIEVTFQITNPEVGNQVGGGESSEQPHETVTLIGNDFLTAKNTANAFVARELTLNHTKVLIVSEELARSKEFINVLQTATREKELRRDTSLIISREKASEFLNQNKPVMETRPHKYYQFMIERARETGIIPKSNIHRFFQMTEGDADLFLGMYATSKVGDKGIKEGNEDEYIAGDIHQQGGNTTQFMGSAVFKEGQMIGTLTGEETRMARLLDNTMEMDELLATYSDPKDPEYRVAARVIKKKKTSINVDYKKGAVTHIKVSVPINIEIISLPSLQNYQHDIEAKKLLKSSIEEQLEKKAKELIKVTQEEYKAEPFYWSLYVRNNFQTIKEYEEADWNKKIYPDANIDVDFKVDAVKFGKQIKESNLSEIRD